MYPLCVGKGGRRQAKEKDLRRFAILFAKSRSESNKKDFQPRRKSAVSFFKNVGIKLRKRMEKSLKYFFVLIIIIWKFRIEKKVKGI